MLAKLLPILLAVTGLGAGVGAGMVLRPVPKQMAMSMEHPCGDGAMAEMDKKMSKDMPAEEDPTAFDFVRLNNQFVVPVVSDSRVTSLVVLSLTIQAASGETENIFQMEPKLRDMLLQVMFDHANSGGFDGPFTEAARMRILRSALVEAAQRIAGDIVSDVLITNVVRQDA